MNDDVVKKLEYWAFKLCGKGEQEDAASDVMSEALKEIIKLRDETERLARERNEARAEVERLRGVLQRSACDCSAPGECHFSELEIVGGCLHLSARKALEAKP